MPSRVWRANSACTQQCRIRLLLPPASHTHKKFKSLFSDAMIALRDAQAAHSFTPRRPPAMPGDLTVRHALIQELRISLRRR